MLKSKLTLEFEGKEDRKYTLTCEPNSPLGELHDALFAMKQFVVDKINEATKIDQKVVPETTKEVEDEQTS